jgi:exodeoxyribonuclease VIII
MYSPGIYEMELDEYLSVRTHVSSSGLKQILRSPAHFLRYLNRKEESLPHLDLGAAVHCAILEPERFQREYVSLPVSRVDIFHEADLQLILGEKQVRFLTETQMQAVEGIVEQLERKPDILRMLQRGQAEKSLFWQDEETGIRCKIRPDMLVLPEFMLELKTTFDPSIPVFQRTCQMQLYHLAAAMYQAGVEQVTGYRPAYMFVVASRFPPYNVETYVPSRSILDKGNDLFRTALRKLKSEKGLMSSYLQQ